MTSPVLDPERYTVAWIAPLEIEARAARAMLDKLHNGRFPVNKGDDYIFLAGEMCGHNIVIATFPIGTNYGTGAAAALAAQVKKCFPNLWFGLLVGVAAGLPSPKNDIRLGDVLVGVGNSKTDGIVAYDLGRVEENMYTLLKDGHALTTTESVILSAIGKIKYNWPNESELFQSYFKKMEAVRHPDGTFEDPGTDKDQLRMGVDEARRQEWTRVWYGPIGSGDKLMKDAQSRDKYRDQYGLIGLEMEAAGIMNTLRVGVIRGVCDYGDKHKQKEWQPYAAAMAAAYAKAVLEEISSEQSSKEGALSRAKQEQMPRLLHLPFQRNRKFIGRSKELDILSQKLLVNQDCQKVSIVGLGGMGKTQVALQFAYTVKENWPDYSIFWVPVLSMASFEQACAEIAKTLGIPQVVDVDEDSKELVKKWLSEGRAGKWLLVLDNVDDLDVAKGIFRYLPKSEQGLTVYTTRTQEVAVFLTPGEDVIELEQMSQPDAEDLLKKSLIRKTLVDASTVATELLHELVYLPLAIAQAAAYLNVNKDLSIADYLQQLRTTEQEMVTLMSREFHDDTRYEGSVNAVATTWVVSFQQIREHNAAAANLLEFISCVEWKAIPRSLLPSVQPQPLAQMQNPISTLCGYSFLDRQEDDKEEGEEGEVRYDMHRLVHLAARIWTREHGNTAGTTEKAVQHVTKVFPSHGHANRAQWRAYLPHALRLLNNLQDCNVERSRLCLLVGQCLRVDGRIREAVKWLEESCRWGVNRQASQHALAGAYRADGQVKKAVELLEQVVAVKEHVLAEDHPSRLASQHALGIAYQADGQVKKAVKLLEQVVAVREKVLAEDHPDRLASQHALAGAYQADGQVMKAVELLEQVVAVHEKVQAEDYPDRLASQHALAGAYQADGQVKKAVELLEQVVAVHEKVLAEDHPSRLASQHALGIAYRADGQVKKAVELLEQVVAVKEHVLAEDHPSRLASQHALGIAYRADGQVMKVPKLTVSVLVVGVAVVFAWSLL